MPLPRLNGEGELPEGVHRASLGEVVTRFGAGSLRRRLATSSLLRVYELARGTGKLDRFVVFGSYVTDAPDPNDVDIIIIMRDDFRETDYTEDVLPVLDHRRARSASWGRAFSGRGRRPCCSKRLTSLSPTGRLSAISVGGVSSKSYRRRRDDQ